MRANIEITQNPVARLATAERLKSECNGGVVLAEDVVLDGEGTLNSWDRLDVEGIMTKVLELEDVVMFGLIRKPRLFRVLSIKPGG